MSAPVVVGIDPGAHGAIALLDLCGNLLEVHDMPSLPESSGRVATNAPLLAEILAKSHALIAYCEYVGARPTDAKVSAFAFGRARGVIEGCCGALSIPVQFITPPTWKRFADVPPGVAHKQVARTRAIAMWPQHAGLFARVKDCDRADACWIGLCGVARENRLPMPSRRRRGEAPKTTSDLFEEAR
jgi:crossover junction endodeoxyribonuclease RuvC